MLTGFVSVFIIEGFGCILRPAKLAQSSSEFVRLDLVSALPLLILN